MVVFATAGCVHDAWPLLPLNAPCSTVPDGDDFMFNVVKYLAGLTLEELNSQFSLNTPAEGVHKWTIPAEDGGTKTILIREHYKQMLKTLYTTARLRFVGTPLPQLYLHNSKALLRGTPGTGKSTLMLVLYIELLKMLKSANDAEGTDCFFPKVQCLVLRWSGMCKGSEVVVGNGADYKCIVHLYDAGDDLPQLPSSQGTGHFIAVASVAHPDRYRRWVSKAFPRLHFSLLWSWPEVKCLWELTRERLEFNISLEDLRERYCLVGGIPQMIFEIKDLLGHIETAVSTLAAKGARAICSRLRNAVFCATEVPTSEGGHSIFALAVPEQAREKFDTAEVCWLLCCLRCAVPLLLWLSLVSICRVPSLELPMLVLCGGVPARVVHLCASLTVCCCMYAEMTHSSNFCRPRLPTCFSRGRSMTR